MSFVYAVATMDTKAEELEFLASCLRAAGVEVKTVDVGTLSAPTIEPDISRDVVLAGTEMPGGEDRGQAITAMGQAFSQFLSREVDAQQVSGVIGIGGSGGTALITRAMRELPIGLPKLMLSTVASGNTAPYVDCCDIIMMFSVVDIVGLNVVSRKVLANAAHAMSGMVKHRPADSAAKDCLGMTMFGVTTPCVTAVREALEREYDCLVFHATGTGGRAMEGLVRSGMIHGVLDITTTEVADEIVGGIFPAGPNRFDALVNSEIPLVLSVGAVDMVNFGAVDTVPREHGQRNLHVHNAQVTLMRTTVDENRLIAEWIAKKLNQSDSAFTLAIPEGGVSMLDMPDAPFYDPAANEALFSTLESQVRQSSKRRVVRHPYHINAPEFSTVLVDEFLRLVRTAN